MGRDGILRVEEIFIPSAYYIWEFYFKIIPYKAGEVAHRQTFVSQPFSTTPKQHSYQPAFQSQSSQPHHALQCFQYPPVVSASTQGYVNLSTLLNLVLPLSQMIMLKFKVPNSLGQGQLVSNLTGDNIHNPTNLYPSPERSYQLLIYRPLSMLQYNIQGGVHPISYIMSDIIKEDISKSFHRFYNGVSQKLSKVTHLRSTLPPPELF